MQAQPDWISGYLLSAPLFSGASVFSPSNASNFNRFRLNVDPSAGPFSLEVAYEHAVTFQQHPFQLGLGLTGLQSGAEWWDLGGTITPSRQQNAVWQHRLDRFNIGWSPTDNVDIRVGRQAIAWGTTGFLSPADPFVPFVPSDPIRLYRAGVDAFRVRVYPSALSEVDFVVRPTRTEQGGGADRPPARPDHLAQLGDLRLGRIALRRYGGRNRTGRRHRALGGPGGGGRPGL